MGQELLEYARDATAPGTKTRSATEYRWLARRLTEALADVLRVAESRGQRIPDQEEANEDAWLSDRRRTSTQRLSGSLSLPRIPRDHRPRRLHHFKNAICHTRAGDAA